MVSPPQSKLTPLPHHTVTPVGVSLAVSVLIVTAAAGAATMMDPAQLDAFYSADATASWRSVLGKGMHYHHGMWLENNTALE